MSESHPFNPDLLGDCVDCPLPKAHPVHVLNAADLDLPEKPYDGTSGWSGSETSRERAVREDGDGTTSERQHAVLALLGARERTGATWKEVAQVEGWHHGQASGALSTLHKVGRIARLAHERRDRCSVYVLPEHVNGRETVAQGRRSADPDVVRREEWRIVDAPHAPDVITATDVDNAGDVRRRFGGRMQHRVVIETPWEDVIE